MSAPTRPGRGPGRPPFVARQAGIITTPTITSVTPNADRIAGGVTVTITGTNFRSGANVTFRRNLEYAMGVNATSIVVVNSTTITCTVPASRTAADRGLPSDYGAGSYNIRVANADGGVFTLYDAFTYYEGAIVEISPTWSHLSGNTNVVITGVNFVAGSTIKFGGIAATSVVFVDDQHFACVVPAHAVGSVDVVITEPSAATVTLRNGFKYTQLVRQQDIRRQPSIHIADLLNNAPNTCDFTVDGTSQAPETGSELIITDNGRVIFGGNVQSVEQSYEDDTANLAWRVHCIDYTWLLNKRRPFGTYDNVSASSVVLDLMGRYAPVGYTTKHVQSNLANVSCVFDGKRDFATCLSQIAQALGEGHWYVDYNKDLHFYHVTPMQSVSVAGLRNFNVRPTDPMPLRVVGTPMTIADGAVAAGLGTSFVPGYYVMFSSNVYGTARTTTTPPAVTVPTGWVQLSDQAALVALSGRVTMGSYGFKALTNVGTTPSDPHFSSATSAGMVQITQEAARKQIDLPVNIGSYGFGASGKWAVYVLTQPFGDGGPRLVNYIESTDPNDPDGTEIRRRTAAGGNRAGSSWFTNNYVMFASPDVSAQLNGETLYFERGWVGFNAAGAQVALTQKTLLPAGEVYFASAAEAAAAEAAAFKTIETAISAISNCAFLTNPPTISNIPIALGLTGYTLQQRRIYFYRYGNAKQRTGSNVVGYTALTNNVTTTLTSALPTANDFKVPAFPFVAPPAGPTTAPNAAQTTTLINSAAYLPTAPTPGYYAFKVAGVYQDGTETFPSTASNTILVDGTSQVALDNLPIFPAINGVACVYRKVYASIYVPFSPLTAGTPDFKNGHVNLVWIITDNTSTHVDMQTGSGLMGGRRAVPIGTPHGSDVDEHADGVFLEDDERPGDIDDFNTDLLHEGAGNPFTSTVDSSQVRNRIFVIGAGSVLVADAARGDTKIKVSDVSMYEAFGGQFITGSRVLSYATVSSDGAGTNYIYLPTPLADPILQADWKYGGGTPLRVFVQIDDTASQKRMGQLEVDASGNPTDGVHEYTIDDSSLTTTEQCINRGIAELELFSNPIVNISYSTRDPKTRSGKMVHVNLTHPPCTGDFIIQEVNIDQIHDESDDLQPRYTVRADSAARFDLNDLLLRLSDSADSPKSSINTAGLGAVASTVSAAAAVSFLTTTGSMNSAQVCTLNVTPLLVLTGVTGKIIVPFFWERVYAQDGGTFNNGVTPSIAYRSTGGVVATSPCLTNLGSAASSSASTVPENYLWTFALNYAPSAVGQTATSFAVGADLVLRSTLGLINNNPGTMIYTYSWKLWYYLIDAP